ncbi:MAG: PDZ domain-containing protein [Planctomycetales bacterium]
MRRKSLVVIALLLLGYFSGAIVSSRAVEEPPPRAADDVFHAALDHIEKYHSAKIPREDLVSAAIEGILLRYDPDGAYIGADEMLEYNQTVTFPRGFPAIVCRFERHLTIAGLDFGMGLSEQGIQPGDRILEIDGQSVEVLLDTEVRATLWGAPGTVVQFRIESAKTGEVREIALARECVMNCD